MPKPKHAKKRYYAQKKRENPAVAQPQQAVPAAQPAARAEPSPAKAPATAPAHAVAQYPYVTTELIRISVLAAIVLVILVVLALALR